MGIKEQVFTLIECARKLLRMDQWHKSLMPFHYFKAK